MATATAALLKGARLSGRPRRHSCGWWLGRSARRRESATLLAQGRVLLNRLLTSATLVHERLLLTMACAR